METKKLERKSENIKRVNLLNDLYLGNQNP